MNILSVIMCTYPHVCGMKLHPALQQEQLTSYATKQTELKNKRWDFNADELFCLKISPCTEIYY